ncbi:hypothetical protein BC832DRAFT_130349 [Gaertneriomyces semiglobifer]|nr:hypothetical protein BC832DRAFT_130349 [Gaertneriomyces semiglobifer]
MVCLVTSGKIRVKIRVSKQEVVLFYSLRNAALAVPLINFLFNSSECMHIDSLQLHGWNLGGREPPRQGELIDIDQFNRGSIDYVDIESQGHNALNETRLPPTHCSEPSYEYYCGVSSTACLVYYAQLILATPKRTLLRNSNSAHSKSSDDSHMSAEGYASLTPKKEGTRCTDASRVIASFC